MTIHSNFNCCWNGVKSNNKANFILTVRLKYVSTWFDNVNLNNYFLWFFHWLKEYYEPIWQNNNTSFLECDYKLNFYLFQANKSTKYINQMILHTDMFHSILLHTHASRMIRQFIIHQWIMNEISKAPIKSYGCRKPTIAQLSKVCGKRTPSMIFNLIVRI